MQTVNYILIICTCLFLTNLSYASNGTDVLNKERSAWKREPTKAPIYSAQTLGKISLGSDLFFDTRLSGNHKLSCASCHSPDLGWSDGLSVSIGRDGKTLKRTSLSILNIDQHSLFMWDGRATTLHEQTLLPITSADEMNLPLGEISKRIEQVTSYHERFNHLYTDGVTLTNIVDAIVRFEKTIISTTSRFDQWVEGDDKALTEEEIFGFKLFTSPDKGNCTVCHQAPNFTDQGFHNIGLVDIGANESDLGRYTLVPIAVLKGAFRTPGLRDIQLTRPYFHNGSAVTLEEVVDYYAKGGKYKNNLSDQMKPLTLNGAEQKAIVAFMKALSSI